MATGGRATGPEDEDEGTLTSKFLSNSLHGLSLVGYPTLVLVYEN